MDYKTQRIKNALKENPDSPAKVRQQVMVWALEDPKLMAELVKPHLSGIVSYAIARVEHAGNEPEAIGARDSVEAFEAQEGSFGLEILKTIAGGDTAIFGMEGRNIGAKKGVSKGHVDALRKIAQKSKE